MPAHCIPRAADRATAVRCCCVVAIRCVLRGDVAAMVNGIMVATAVAVAVDAAKSVRELRS